MISSVNESSRVYLRSKHQLLIPPLPKKNISDSGFSKNEEIRLVHQIQTGDTFSTILSQYGTDQTVIQEILDSADWVDRLDSILPGETINLTFSQDEVLEELIYTPSKTETIKFYLTDFGYKSQRIIKEPDRLIAFTHGTINSSLFLDGKKAGLSDKLIIELNRVFAWKINFSQNIQPDDQFTLVYEKLYLDGEEFDTGNILAAEVVTQGQTLRSLRYENSHGRVDYYDPEGNNLRKAFLRFPVEYSRISSRFKPHRKHPVLNKIRAHKGVDYAAPKGTPVYATGDGTIDFVGTKNGYGRVIIIQHQQKHTTLYAHLLGFDKNIKTGAAVKQGQAIGFVGKSGLASGYHLHYEFRANKVHRDPLRVRLPKAPSIEKTKLANFKLSTNPLLNKLDKAKVLLARI